MNNKLKVYSALFMLLIIVLGIGLYLEIQPQPEQTIQDNYIELEDNVWYEPVNRSCYTPKKSSFKVVNFTECSRYTEKIQ